MFGSDAIGRQELKDLFGTRTKTYTTAQLYIEDRESASAIDQIWVPSHIERGGGARGPLFTANFDTAFYFM